PRALINAACLLFSPSPASPVYNDPVVRVGGSIEDYCRACKLDRMHTVVAADPNGVPIRVACGYCSSEHNYRGGPRTDTREPAERSAAPRESKPAPARPVRTDRQPFPLVSERERIAP